MCVSGYILREETRCLLGGSATCGCVCVCVRVCVSAAACQRVWMWNLKNIPEDGCMRLDLRSPSAVHGCS